MSPSSTINSYLELSKPRILQLILVTTAIGFFMGGKGIHSWELLIWTLIGAGCTCAGASALNNYLERDADARMLRTRNRPLPAGRITPQNALFFGILMVLLGVTLLAVKVNILTAFLSLLTAFLYTLVYTPMKKVSWLNTSIGAIPGAIPPMGGWSAATGDITLGAWVLFAIMFIWQHPHFYAIAWMFREDYARGGFKMLPVVEPDGKKTFLQVIVFSLILIPVSLAPAFLGMTGMKYLGGAAVLGGLLLWVGLLVARSRSFADARNLLRASVVYLPLLLFLIVIDASF